MNEATAHAFGAKDAHIFIERLAAMKSPDEIEREVVRFAARRASAVDRDHAKEISRALVTTQRAPTLSGRLLGRLQAMLDASHKAGSPEGTRSLLLWLTGSPQLGPGFAQQVLEAVPDQNTHTAIGAIQDRVTDLRKTLDDVDQDLFNRVLRDLPRPQRKIAGGMIFQARFSYESGDPERYRAKLDTARAFIRRHQPRTSQAGPRGRRGPPAGPAPTR